MSTKLLIIILIILISYYIKNLEMLFSDKHGYTYAHNFELSVVRNIFYQFR